MDQLIVSRHGESEYSARAEVNGDPRLPNGLTPKGREQARRLGELLAHEPIDLCVTTEFPRTQETADLALAGRDIPRLVVADLNDPAAGAFEGKELAEYRAWAHSHGPEDDPPGGGESRADAVRRYARGFSSVLERPESVVLVVGHSLPIAYVLAAARGREPAAAMGLVPYAEVQRLSSAELEAAIGCLEAWVAAPAF